MLPASDAVRNGRSQSIDIAGSFLVLPFSASGGNLAPLALFPFSGESSSCGAARLLRFQLSNSGLAQSFIAPANA
jgi:hypothetical protein